MPLLDGDSNYFVIELFTLQRREKSSRKSANDYSGFSFDRVSVIFSVELSSVLMSKFGDDWTIAGKINYAPPPGGVGV